MGRKLRHVLIFLLIILKELQMPEADCSCEPSSRCKCPNLGLTSIPQNLPTSISILDLASLLQLQHLYVNNNQITTIRYGIFSDLPKLQYLYLDKNQISTIRDAGTFANLPQLQRLSLKGNRITTIPSVSCLFPSNITIELDGNPWQCDCRMAPVRQIPTLNDQIICAQPAKLQGQKLLFLWFTCWYYSDWDRLGCDLEQEKD
ncbi:hypothetical protein Bbelb_249150 [Branchiostoma belcheri]|nr:hypothetical protein Bbelb_249150 [Branchiostoma belcheri]